MYSTIEKQCRHYPYKGLSIIVCEQSDLPNDRTIYAVAVEIPWANSLITVGVFESFVIAQAETYKLIDSLKENTMIIDN